MREMKLSYRVRAPFKLCSMALFRNKKKLVIKFAKINENLEIQVDEIKKLITNKTKIIAITHISNVTGGITPLKEIIDLASSKKFLY